MSKKEKSPEKKEYDKIAMWLINMECNFNCPYCFYDDSQRSLKTRVCDWVREKVPPLNPYKTRIITPEEIGNFFDSTGLRWWIMISGGEPFLYPKFLDIIERLSQKHLITIGTNLSIKVDDFIKRISPKNIWSFYISLHLGERERMGLSKEELLEKALKLKKAGFRIEVNYVMYPPLIDRFQETQQFFKKHDIDLEAKVFRGVYKGKEYPQSYTKKQREFFYKHIPSRIDQAASFENLSFLNVPCTAGLNLIRINPNGTITRCPHDHENLGNIFKNKMNLHKKVKPCKVKYCKCTLAIKEGCVDFEKRV
jgi:MoaA/NifB/PqqE/SkfB family radical SAM enzyme